MSHFTASRFRCLTLCLSTHHGGGVVLRELLVGEGDPSLLALAASSTPAKELDHHHKDWQLIGMMSVVSIRMRMKLVTCQEPKERLAERSRRNQPGFRPLTPYPPLPVPHELKFLVWQF